MEQPPLRDLDFSVLDDPEFKEDSVREEIVAPIVRALGYEPTGRHRVVRSRALEHPYVSIGSIRRQVKIYPDYLLSVNERLRWVLDAKSPTEPVDDPDHVSQVYTYAIHKDVRVDWFAICNGHELAVYNVADASSTARLRVRIRELANAWDDITDLLSPTATTFMRTDYAKDFGVMMMKLKIPETTTSMFPGVPVTNLGRVGEDLFSFSGRFHSEDGDYAATFDFERPLLEKLLGLFPPGNAEPLRAILMAHPTVGINLQAQVPPMVTVYAHRGTEFQENENEFYVPFRVTDFEFFM